MTNNAESGLYQGSFPGRGHILADDPVEGTIGEKDHKLWCIKQRKCVDDQLLQQNHIVLSGLAMGALTVQEA